MIRRRGAKWQIGVHTEAANESDDSHRQLEESLQRPLIPPFHPPSQWQRFIQIKSARSRK